MADRCALKKYYINGKKYSSETFSTNYKPLVPSVYEVIRIMDGIPLFLEEHYARLINSLASINRKAPVNIEELRSSIRNLAEANDVKCFNVKLVINNFSEDGNTCTHYLFFIPTSYPTEEMYENGVPTDFLNAVRNNPHAKIINQSLRDNADALMKEKNLFEAVLVNEKGQITEGSRSNLFFIKGSDVYTCPSDGVLLGVTRQRIVRICEENGISVIESHVEAEKITSYDAGFISGTSPKVLPIANIGGTRMDVQNATLRRIMNLYDNEIQKYLS